MKRIRVLIVEDSAVVREHLRRIISADSRFEVTGMAESGEEAIHLVGRLSPDVITMDIHLPGMQGFDATRHIMAQYPTPIVIVSGIEAQDVNLTMEAFKAGALSVVEKPVATGHASYDEIAAKLCTQLAIMSEVKVIRQRAVSSKASYTPPPVWSSILPHEPYRILAIGASTGGPTALLQLLTGLGTDFPLPIAIVQHMTPGFLSGFAGWLSSATKFPVTVVNRASPLRPGEIHLAPSGSHLVISGTMASPDDGAAVGSHRPSANVLFSSVARSLGPSAIGVLLTGMGDDGARGLREVKAAGGFTIAEAESTAVVYGMPAAAVQLNAVRESLPLGDIASRIRELIKIKPGVL